MQDFQKIVNPISKKIGDKFYQVFIKIEFKDGKLSMSGVEGPNKRGNCKGSCGQINEGLFKGDFKTNKGWTLKLIKRLLDCWKEWHLNDMRPGCKHQIEAGWQDVRIDPKELPNTHANQDKKGILATWVLPTEHKDGLLTKPCPTCGYKYGSAWLKEEVPQDVIEFLKSLPDSKIIPAWC